MPYAEHVRMTAIGAFGSGLAEYEQFAWTLSLAPSSLGGFSSAGARELMDDTAADVGAFHASGISLPGSVRLKEVKFALIGPDGTYVEDAYIVPQPRSGSGQEAAQFPPQVALAISLQTERRGASGRGRFYIPAPLTTVSNTTGQMGTPQQENVLAAAVTMINAVNNAPNLDVNGPRFQVVVASSKGFLSPVTAVRVGKALDTIRSRRRSIPEAYLAAQIAQ